MNCLRKLKKPLIVFLSTLIASIAAVILCSSFTAKYLIEKYDEKFTGRKITVGWAYVNPFTGDLHLSNLKIYEYHSDSISISMKGLSARINLTKLFSNTLNIKKVTLDQPTIKIIQRKTVFNFNDLIIKYSPKKPRNITANPFHFSCRNITIKEGHFYFTDEVIPVHFSIKNVNLESKDGYRWDKDLISAKVSFLSENGNGGMKINFGMNVKNLFYKMNVNILNFNLNVLEQYMKGFANYGTFDAFLDADLKTDGCFSNAENINISGKLVLRDLRLGKDSLEDYVSFDKLSLNMNDVNPVKRRYIIDTVLLIHPYLRFELYDHGLNNAEAIFGNGGSSYSSEKDDNTRFNVIFIIGKYIKKLAKNFFQSNYKVDHVAISRGDIVFNDYSLSEKFTAELNPLTITADTIDKNHRSVDIFLNSAIKPYGNVTIAISINPKDTGNFDLQYHVQKIPISIFNPYIISYTSFPLDKGTIGLNGIWNVRNGIMQSENHLVLIDPRVIKRLRNRDNAWIPLPLIMSLIRERGNVIDYKIPITGNLKDPKFHLRDVIIDLLENIFIKPSSIPYGLVVKNIETKIEKSLTLQWKMRQSSLLPVQEKFVKLMADFLEKNPQATITVYPQTYALKEKEYILFYEAKKIYYLKTKNKTAQSFNNEDAEKIDKMSVKDDGFVNYLNKLATDSLTFTVQGKCLWLIDQALVNAKLQQLNRERKKVFISYFKECGVEKQIKFAVNQSVIPYNGFSFYKIEYDNELPKSIIRAYSQMEDLNNVAPRKKYLKKRIKIGNTSK